MSDRRCLLLVVGLLTVAAVLGVWTAWPQCGAAAPSQPPFAFVEQEQKWLGSAEACRFPHRFRKAAHVLTSSACRQQLTVLDWDLPRFGEEHEWRNSRSGGGELQAPEAMLAFVEALKLYLNVALPPGVVPDNERFARLFEDNWRGDCDHRLRRTYNHRQLAAVDVVYVDYPFPYLLLRQQVGAEQAAALLPPQSSARTSVLYFSGESAEYYPALFERPFFDSFNLTIGYHCGWFDVCSPTLLYYGSVDELAALQHVRPVLAASQPLAAMIVSNCAGLNHRTAYLSKLMDSMPVDSYGHCLHNRDFDAAVLQRHDATDTHNFYAGRWRQVKHDTFARYTFGLAFENSNCYDYVTEKLFDVLAAGAVPVYMGAPNIDQYAPPGSYIDARWFRSPEELAAYLLHVASDEKLLATYHHWRQQDIASWPWLTDARMSHSFCSVVSSTLNQQC